MSVGPKFWSVKEACSYKFYQPINQLVTSGNAGLYSQNKIEEGLHSALGIQHENDEAA